MATLTRQQVQQMREQGLSEQRIKELALQKGYTLPSESVSGEEMKKTMGGIGAFAGKALGGLVNPFVGKATENAGRKVGESIGGAVKSVAEFTGAEKLGQGLGYALFQLTPEYKELARQLENGTISPQDFQELATGNITSGEVIGSGIKTAATIASAGTFGGGLSSAAPTATRVFGSGANIARGAGIGATLGGLAGGTQAALEGRNAVGIGAGALGGATVGALGGATGGALLGGGVGQGILRGAQSGIGSGAVFGGAAGLAKGLEEGKSAGGVVAETIGQGARGALVGGAIGGVLGGVAGGVQTAFRNAQIRKKEAFSILSAKPETQTGTITAPTASRTASAYKIDPILKTAVKDKAFTNTLKNAAVQPDDLALIKSSRSGDHQAYKDMIRLAGDDNIYSVEPINSRVGKTFITRLKDIISAQSSAGKDIDRIARTSLSGKQVPQLSETVNSFADELSARGVSVAEDGSLNFKGSDFEDLVGVQRILNTAWRRAQELGDDALKGHQLKRFLDTQLEYGSATEGVTGSAERILKSLRSGVDAAIDTADEAYNVANTRYAKAVKARDIVQRLLGRDFRIDSDLAEARAGEVMQRVLGSAPSRTLQVISDVERTAAELGYKYDDSVIAQIRFADMLEDIVGSPSRSLSGQVTRATKRVLQIPDALKWLPYAENADEFLQTALSKTPQERLTALQNYIESISK